MNKAIIETPTRIAFDKGLKRADAKGVRNKVTALVYRALKGHAGTSRAR